MFIIFLFIKSFHLFYIIFISKSIISLCHQLSWTTFWMPWVIKTYHTHTPDRLCRYSPPWCVLSTGAYYLCFFVQIFVPAYYTQVRTIPREIRYFMFMIFYCNIRWVRSWSTTVTQVSCGSLNWCWLSTRERVARDSKRQLNNSSAKIFC